MWSQGLCLRGPRLCTPMTVFSKGGSCVQASQTAGAQKRQRKGPSWADDPVDDVPSKTIFDDWDDYVKV